MHSDLFRKTPIESYDVSGVRVYVKREDLCPKSVTMPALSKLRGVYRHLVGRKGCGLVGCIDTRISKSGQGTSFIAQQLGIGCNYYFPLRKGDDLSECHIISRDFHDAELVPMTAGRIAIVYARAKKDVERRGGYMLPLGLPLYETVLATIDVIDTIPSELTTGSVIVSTGTGTIISGIVLGLGLRHSNCSICGISASMEPRRQRRRMKAFICKYLSDFKPGGFVVPEIKLYRGCGDYYSPATVDVPFPAHKYYEGKAWAWMLDNLHKLKQPILFYNIGG